MPRSYAFRGAYYAASVAFVLAALPLLAWPSRTPLTRWIRLYARVMTALMRAVGGVDVTVRGRDRMPTGPVILAAKHQSWGDGFVTYGAVSDLAFVCGDHLTRIPLLGGILSKLGAVVVNNCGGAEARGDMASQLARLASEGRSVLIYPEGHLAPVGQHHRYRRGVWHLHQATGLPVVPVATDLGLRWPQAALALRPGPCSVEFLPAIPQGLAKEEFMATLEARIEARSLAMIAEQRAAGTLPAGWRQPEERAAPAPRAPSARRGGRVPA